MAGRLPSLWLLRAPREVHVHSQCVPRPLRGRGGGPLRPLPAPPLRRRRAPRGYRRHRRVPAGAMVSGWFDGDLMLLVRESDFLGMESTTLQRVPAGTMVLRWFRCWFNAFLIYSPIYPHGSSVFEAEMLLHRRPTIFAYPIFEACDTMTFVIFPRAHKSTPNETIIFEKVSSSQVRAPCPRARLPFWAGRLVIVDESGRSVRGGGGSSRVRTPRPGPVPVGLDHRQGGRIHAHPPHARVFALRRIRFVSRFFPPALSLDFGLLKPTQRS